MLIKLGSFAVPVDVKRLQALRKAAGFPSRRAFADELRRRGYAFNYNGVERAGRADRRQTVARIKNETAEAVAEALGVEPDEAFPEYSAAKAAAERHLTETRYKPFTTVVERNAAIVATMNTAKRTALKYANVECEGVPIGWDEAVSSAYETLVEVADFAMKWGIPNRTTFAAYVCSAVKNSIMKKYYRGKYRFYSLDTFDTNCLHKEL